MINTVTFSKRAVKDLKKMPLFILDKIQTWVFSIETNGLENTRLVSGYHDEPLNGRRVGERSIRLNRSYRLIYILVKQEVKFLEVKEVSKHEY